MQWKCAINGHTFMWQIKQNIIKKSFPIHYLCNKVFFFLIYILLHISVLRVASSSSLIFEILKYRLNNLFTSICISVKRCIHVICKAYCNLRKHACFPIFFIFNNTVTKFPCIRHIHVFMRLRSTFI